MMLDATKGPKQRYLLEAELEAVGIRVNKSKPNIFFKVKKGGGLSFNSTCKLNHLNERLVYQVNYTAGIDIHITDSTRLQNS